MDTLLDSDAVSEISVRSKARSRRSASSSARSIDDDFINDDDEEDGEEDNYASDASDEPKAKSTKKSSSKPKASARPPLKSTQSSGVPSSVGENAFLTAAERRALEKKNEKKAGEDPYAFLQDPRDVNDTNHISWMLVLTYFICRKTARNLMNPAMTLVRCISPNPLGLALHHSKNRYVNE